MGIEWRESLSIGVEEIDNQHKELLQNFNRLLKACEEGRGKSELSSLLSFLNDYVVRHFRDEEAIQRQRGFSGYEAHKQEHDYFIAKLRALQEEINTKGVAIHHVMETNNLLLKWLINHISRVDTELGKFLKSIAASK